MENIGIIWTSNVIFPGFAENDKLKIDIVETPRGSIYDRNGKVLAGEGRISKIGLVPGKMNTNAEADIARVAELLKLKTEDVNNALSASYVKSDTFVELAKIPESDSHTEAELMKIAGINIRTSNGRVYPYKDATSNLIGYIQKITEEELEANSGKGYSSSDMIGKVGIEKAYEEKLKGLNGYEIYIVDSKGKKKKTIINRDVKKGEDLKLTIDINIQKAVYNQFKQDESSTIVMNPKTGEILAMCSTPSYDSNDFILGFTNEKWQEIVSNQAEPLYNRNQAAWTPGSSIKPIIASIALETSAIQAEEDLRYKWKRMAKGCKLGNI